MIVRCGIFVIDMPPSLLVWLSIAACLIVFFAIVGRRVARLDPHEAPQGIALWALQLHALCRSLCGSKMSGRRFAFFATLIVMMALSNLAGLLALPLPTANLSVTLALALMMFVLIQRQGLRANGLRGRLRQLCEPLKPMLPLNVISELTLPLSLALRLFGNMLAGTVISLLVYAGIRAFLPLSAAAFAFTPFLHLYFDVFSGLIQTYIFFTLAVFFLHAAQDEDEGG